MYLVDTNVISEIRNAKRRDKAVAAWFANQSLANLYLSVTTIRELYYGAYRLKKTNPSLEKELLNWIEGTIIRMFGANILSIDVETARIHAALELPNSDISGDSLIAATALRHGLIIVTRNTKDFASYDVRTFDPWKFPI